MHNDASRDHEFAFEEAKSLASLEAVYGEFSSHRDAFWAQRWEFPLGYPAHVLATQLDDFAGFSGRFAQFTSAAQQLEAAHHPALRERLSEILADAQRTTSLIREMHEGRLTSEREALGIAATKSNKVVLDTLTHVSRGLRHVLGIDRQENEQGPDARNRLVMSLTVPPRLQ